MPAAHARAALGVAGLLTAGLTACAGPAPVVIPPGPPPTEAVLRLGQARLDALRARAAVPTTRRIALELREPFTGKVLSARGAVALAPPRALRMILLGPGGTTALDLWIDGDSFRFAVPAIELAKRGDLHEPRATRRGLPVDFLAFWLLHPARGELAWYGVDAGGDRFVLRDGDALVELRTRADGAVEGHRSTWAATAGTSADAAPALLEDETVSAAGLGCAQVTYHQRSTGLSVKVACEGETAGDPPARALLDPDLPPPDVKEAPR
jgi:hypothetical protein